MKYITISIVGIIFGLAGFLVLQGFALSLVGQSLSEQMLIFNPVQIAFECLYLLVGVCIGIGTAFKVADDFSLI